MPSEDVEEVKQHDHDERNAKQPGDDAFHDGLLSGLRGPSETAGDRKQQEHDNDKADASRRVVPPAARVAPGRQCADQGEDEKDEKDGADRHGSPPIIAASLAASGGTMPEGAEGSVLG